MLKIETRDLPSGIIVLEITGRIALGVDTKQLESAVENLIRERHKKVIFDLTGVTNIDSTGIGIIVMSAGQLKKEGGELRLATGGHVEQVLKMTSVDKIVKSHSTISDAAAAF